MEPHILTPVQKERVEKDIKLWRDAMEPDPIITEFDRKSQVPTMRGIATFDPVTKEIINVEILPNH